MMMIIKSYYAMGFTDMAFGEKFGLDLGDVGVLRSNISTEGSLMNRVFG